MKSHQVYCEIWFGTLTTRIARCITVAVDSGPRATLRALQTRAGGLISSSGFDMYSLKRWLLFLEKFEPTVVIVGTSRSQQGVFVENTCRRAACFLKIPLVCVEDSLGNFLYKEDAPVDLLFVESDRAAEYYRRVVNLPKETSIFTGAGVRYDFIRKQISSEKRACLVEESRNLLWIGQPETFEAETTLNQLLPAVEKLGQHLYFRAHPCDAGYLSGQYERLFFKYRNCISDATYLGIEQVLELRLQLSLTHFSSMAIELAFWGIPSCNILFSESGGKIFTEVTGLKRPLLCDVGGSGSIHSVFSIESELDRFLFDKQAREAQMLNFDKYFEIDTPQQPRVLDAIERVVLSKQKSA